MHFGMRILLLERRMIDLQNSFSEKQLRKARFEVDLAAFLIAFHPKVIETRRTEVILHASNCILVKNGHPHYRNLDTQETGDALDCLQRYLGYSFADAVRALTK